MLRDNLKALYIASALTQKKTGETTRDELQDALHAFASMICKTEKYHERFSPGTSQHTLQRNRLKALQIAESLIKVELDARWPQEKDAGKKNSGGVAGSDGFAEGPESLL